MIIVSAKKLNTPEGVEDTTSLKVTFNHGVDELGNPIQIISSVPKNEEKIDDQNKDPSINNDQPFNFAV